MWTCEFFTKTKALEVFVFKNKEDFKKAFVCLSLFFKENQDAFNQSTAFLSHIIREIFLPSWESQITTYAELNAKITMFMAGLSLLGTRGPSAPKRPRLVENSQ
jgi:hypothetical protein